MPDKAWKKRERDVAGYFNGIRTSLSGGNSKVTRADVIHDSLFIECKLRAKHTVISLWDDTAKLAKLEGKTPVIALCEKNRPGFWIMVHSSDLDELKKINKNDSKINKYELKIELKIDEYGRFLDVDIKNLENNYNNYINRFVKKILKKSEWSPSMTIFKDKNNNYRMERNSIFFSIHFIII